MKNFKIGIMLSLLICAFLTVSAVSAVDNNLQINNINNETVSTELVVTDVVELTNSGLDNQISGVENNDPSNEGTSFTDLEKKINESSSVSLNCNYTMT